MIQAAEVLFIGALLFNGWQLNEIRKISRACYVELTTGRWEAGQLIRAQDKKQSPPSRSREAHDLPV